jgi:hypothetical protein
LSDIVAGITDGLWRAMKDEHAAVMSDKLQFVAEGTRGGVREATTT